MNTRGDVLVVEDNSDWQNKLAAILEKDGFSVWTAKGLDEALEVLLGQPVHAAVIDLKLKPASSSRDEGFALLEEVHKLGLSKMVYSIIMTGYATPQSIRSAFKKYGVIDFFEKKKFDTDIEQFRQAVREAVIKAKYAQLEKLGFKCFKTGGKCGHTIIQDPDYIFVAMPYKPEQNNLYQYGLQPLESSLECKIGRADEELLDIDLMCKICQLIQKARICIVDITAWNANAIFELGLMYGWGKDVILIKHAEEKVEKVDLKGMEYVPYELDKFEALQKALLQRLIKKGIRPSLSNEGQT